MNTLIYIRDNVLEVSIFVCTSIGTVAGIFEITKCLSKGDYNGAVKTFLMSLLAIGLIYGYPIAVNAIKGMIR